MGLFDRLFGGGSPEEKAAKAQAKADARARREAEERAERAGELETLLQRALGNDPEQASLDARTKAAIKLVLCNETAKGREAWLAIAGDFPDERAEALNQIGVCWHLEKNYRAALDHYDAAIQAGADAGHLADNIAEARAGLNAAP